ncbi:TMEM175 family protein [Nocardia sp. NBC_01327]|uniref:TMEM175 family protein n=1 Tax=Nocardia sp. NBC_01327 TaxID=2903593 RepID=UPI002E1064D1|nr:TMEM175 family protein [Nocardia sp. NBC_01327]
MSLHHNATGHSAGWSPDRIGAFADAVLAIAITLLVVEIKRPQDENLVDAGALAAFLWRERASFVAFVLAFVLLWAVWRRHHTLIYEVTLLDRRTLAWHAPLLLFVAILPYSTAVFGHATDNSLAVCLFALTSALLFASEGVVRDLAARRSALAEHIAPADLRTSADASFAVAAVFVATAALAWLTPHVWYAWFLAPLSATFGGRLIDRLRGDAPIR